MSWIDTRIDAYWSKIETSSANDPDSLRIVRVLWAVFVLAFVVPRFSWLGDVPQGFFNPPTMSLGALLSGFPPPWLFFALDAGLALMIIAVGLGIKARWAAVAAAAIATIGGNFHYSFGKIDHGFLLWATLLCLSQTNWSTRGAMLPDKPVSKERENRALALAGLFVGFGMFTAGLPKLFFWVDFDTSTSGFLAWFYEGYFSLGRREFLAPFVLEMPPRLFEVSDYVCTFFELAALACLFSGRRAWHCWLLMASVFHFANTLFLNITFINHVPVYLMFFPLAKLGALQWLAKRHLVVSTALAALGAYHIFQSFLGTAVRYGAFHALFAAVVLWPLAAAAMGVCLYKERSRALRHFFPLPFLWRS